MESELDEEVFGNMMNAFVQCWEKQESTFVKYFLENYFNRSGNKRCVRSYVTSSVKINMWAHKNCSYFSGLLCHNALVILTK